MREWRPQPRQELFLENPAFEGLFGGAKGPGKTDCLFVEGLRDVANENYKGIIFRRTYPQLQELIGRSMKWLHNYAAWNGSDHIWRFPSHASLRFGHCHRAGSEQDYQGQEFQYMGFDQLEQFNLTAYLYLLTQIRTTDSTIMRRARATANPGGVGHTWVKDRFISRLSKDGKIKFFKRVNDEDVECDRNDPDALSRSFIFSTVYDNKILLKADPTYLATLKALPEKLRKQLLGGDWDAFEGQFFDSWQRNLHVISFSTWKQIEASLPLTRFVALDYGYNAPASVGWYAVTPSGDMIRYRELYVTGHTYESLARKIVELTPTKEKIEYLVSDPAIWGDKNTFNDPKPGEAKGKNGADVMREIFGKRFPILRGDNRRVVGWNRCREMIEPYQDQHKNTSAQFKVVETCRNFIRCITGLVHDDNNPEDVDTDGEDHAADEWRYAIMSRVKKPKMPPKEATSTEKFWSKVQADMRRTRATEAGDEAERPITEGIPEEGAEV